MQWDSSPNAGFTTGKPWLRLADDAMHRNVEKLKGDPQSILTLYRRLIELRRDSPALTVGSYRLLEAHHHVLVYERHHGGDELVIALNLGYVEHTVDLPQARSCDLVLSTRLDTTTKISPTQVTLRPSEGVILRPRDA
jgi:glycosidase